MLIAANIKSATNSSTVYLVRYNGDGTIDSTFGTAGKVTLSIGNNVPPAQIGQTSDGKILVAQSNYLTRYNIDGTIDTSFANAGTLTSIDPEVSDPNFQGRSVRKFIQSSDGKLVLVKSGFATGTGTHHRVDRYNLDGTLDNTFSGDFNAGGVANIIQQSDGKIVVVGDLITERNDTSGYLKNLVATRYSNGIVTPPETVNNAPIVANPIATQSAVTGITYSLSVPTNTFSDVDAGDTLSYTATLANGNPLPTWLTFDAATGVFSGIPTTADVGSLSLTIKATDKGGLSVTNDFGLSIATATTPNPTNLAPGDLDPTFGTNGKFVVDIGSTNNNTVSGAIVLQDGKTIEIERDDATLIPVYRLKRYNTNGTLDATFGTSGVAVIDYDSVIRLSSNDKILASNISGLSQYNSDGSIDTSFGTGGTIAIDEQFERGEFIQQRSGKILLVSDNAIRRYNLDGSVDASFGTNGKVTVPTNFSIADATQVFSQGIAQLVVTGSKYVNNTTNGDFDILRYSVDGVLDTSFGMNGEVMTDFDNGFDRPLAIGQDNNGNIIIAGGSGSSGGYSTSFAAARYASDGTTISNPGDGGGGGGNNPTSPIPGLSLTNNLFNTDATIAGFSIQALSQKSSNKVNQIVMFAVDDATGKIGTLLPGAAGYLQAALSIAKPIFSTLGGSFFSTDSQQVAFNPNAFHQFIEIQDASISDLQQQLALGITPTNVLYSTPDANGNSPFKVSENSTKDGYQISINGDKLVLGLTKLAGGILNRPIGTKSQTLPEGRTIDLRDYANQPLKVDLNAKSDALFNNNIGFYAVEDAAGTIKLADGSSIGAGDSRYATEAVKKAIANAVFSANKTDSKTGQNITGGSLYAPVAISQGSLNDFVNINPTNGGGGNNIHAYFNYLGANPDKVDHFRLLGANTFGFEDIYGGGDRDFNDVVISLKIST